MRAVETENVENVGRAALGNTVEGVGAERAASLDGSGSGSGKGNAGHGHDGDDEGLHFELDEWLL